MDNLGLTMGRTMNAFCISILEKTMKFIIAALMLFISTYSLAESDQAILLNPMQGNTNLSVTKVINIYGKCGDTVVAVLGVESDGFDGKGNFKIDAAGNSDLQLRNGGKDISYQYILSDYNITHCIQTKNGARLLVGSICAGSSCGDEFSYYVIDPKNGSILPGKGSKKNCDAKCANQALGMKYLK